MSTTFLAPDPVNSTYFITGGNTPANGGLVFFYAAGTNTKQTVYRDSQGLTPWTNPVVLDSGGNIPSGGVIWFSQGLTYKVVFAPSNDSDPPASPYWSKDNLSGINDVSQSGSEWVAAPTPAFVSASTFTFASDQTVVGLADVGRRMRFTVTAGTVYGSIYARAFASSTSVQVVMDSGQALDSGLSAASYGLLTAKNPSVPLLTASRSILMDITDNTKQVAFSASSVANSTTVNADFQNKSITVAGLVDIPGVARVMGCISKLNSTSNATKWDMQAAAAVLVNTTSRYSLSNFPVSTITVDITQSSQANGRDQTSSFTASTFVHFYRISNGTTFAGIGSANGPSIGPVLTTAALSSFSLTAYDSSCLLANGTTLVNMYARGPHMCYVGKNVLINNGGAQTESSIVNALNVLAPSSVALMIKLSGNGTATTAAQEATGTFNFYVSSGVIYSTPLQLNDPLQTAAQVTKDSGGISEILPITGYLGYRWTSVTGFVSADLAVSWFTVPNGS